VPGLPIHTSNGVHVVTLLRSLPGAQPTRLEVNSNVALLAWPGGESAFAIRNKRFNASRAAEVCKLPEARALVDEAEHYLVTLREAAVPFKSYPKDEASSWSFSAKDGDDLLGPDKSNWARFKAAHAWQQGRGTPKAKGAYRLPHHKLKDGRMTTFLSGVQAAVNVMAGGRGGVRIPSAERAAVIRHLGRHLGEFGRQLPPTLRRQAALAPGSTLAAAARYNRALAAAREAMRP
jgi:hypothetical protein